MNSDGTYGVTANGKTVGSSASGGIFTSASLPTGSASFNLGGDHVTTDVSVSVSNSQSSGGLSWGDVVDFFVAPVAVTTTVWWLATVSYTHLDVYKRQPLRAITL